MSGAGDNVAQPPSGKAFRVQVSHGADPSGRSLQSAQILIVAATKSAAPDAILYSAKAGKLPHN